MIVPQAEIEPLDGGMVAPAWAPKRCLGASWGKSCISKGTKDAVGLDGRNVLMAVHSPKQMTEGRWKAVVYLDERANPEQVDALTAIFSGQAAVTSPTWHL